MALWSTISAFTDCAIGGQGPVHRAPMTDIGSLINQGGVDLAWRAFGKAVTVGHRADLDTLIGRERTGGMATWSCCGSGLSRTIGRAVEHTECATCGGNAHVGARSATAVINPVRRLAALGA